LDQRAANSARGLAPPIRDLDKLTDWLERHHFQINVVYPSGMVIDFTGHRGTSAKSLPHGNPSFSGPRPEAHCQYQQPADPGALSSLVWASCRCTISRRTPCIKCTSAPSIHGSKSLGGTDFALVPADLATIYNLNPLFSAGNSGQGQTIALIEDTTYLPWRTGRPSALLWAYPNTRRDRFPAVHPAPPSGTNNCRNPGIVAPNDAEAILDGEWASAAAPSATISMVSCKDTNTTSAA